MFGLGPTELVIIFLVILLLFGGKKIPEIARGLGKGLKEFKAGRAEKISDSTQESIDSPTTTINNKSSKSS